MPRRSASALPFTTQGRLVARQTLFSIGPAIPKQAFVGLGAGADLRGRIGQELLREHIQPRVGRRRVRLLEGRLHPAQPGGRTS
jgi:hypothetical protein